MPQAPIEKQGISGAHTHGSRVRVFCVVRRELHPVEPVTAGNHMGATAVRRLDIGKHKRHLERHARTRVGLEVNIQPAAVLVPSQAAGFGGIVLRQRRRDDEVAVVELNVPAENVDDLRDRPGPIEEFQERFVEPDAVPVVEPFVGTQSVLGPVFDVEPISRIDHPCQGLRRQHVPCDEEPLLVERPALLVRQPVVQTSRVHAPRVYTPRRRWGGREREGRCQPVSISFSPAIPLSRTVFRRRRSRQLPARPR